MTQLQCFKLLVKGMFTAAMFSLFLWKMFERIVRFQQEDITLGDKVKIFIRSNFFIMLRYRVFHRFGQAKFPDGGLVLVSSQFSVLPPKMMLSLKDVQINSKISNLLC